MDVYSYDFFTTNSPRIEERSLNNNIVYKINPNITKGDDNHMIMKLDNLIIVNDVSHKYIFQMYIWKKEFLIYICSKYGLELVHES